MGTAGGLKYVIRIIIRRFIRVKLLPPGNPGTGAPYPGGGPPLLNGPKGGGGPKLKPPGGGPPPLSYAEVIWSMIFCALSWPSARKHLKIMG